MDFNVQDDRQLMAAALQRFLADRYPIPTRNGIAYSTQGFSPRMWRDFVDLGVVGALFDPACGGLGGTGFDFAALFEALGGSLVVEPFLGVAMAGRALVEAGGREELLAAAIQGEAVPVFAHDEPQSGYGVTEVTTRAKRTATGWVLTGRKVVVPQIGAASHILVTARTSGEPGDPSGLSLFLVPVPAGGLRVMDYGLIDGGRAGDLKLEGAEATLLGREGEAVGIIEAALAVGTVCLCWEAVGIMEQLKTATVEFLQARVQFGASIGRFQALRHRIVTLAIEVEQTRSAAINAATALDRAPTRAQLDRALSAAKYTVGRAGTLVAEEAIQMHGAIGMTWETPVAHYAKRLIMLGHQLGDEDFHMARYLSLRSHAVWARAPDTLGSRLV